MVLGELNKLKNMMGEHAKNNFDTTKACSDTPGWNNGKAERYGCDFYKKI